MAREKRVKQRFFSKLIRYVLIFITVAVIILALQVVVLPRLVQRIILSNLTDIGLSTTSLEVRSCSWCSAELANVVLGKDCCTRIGALTAQYSLSSLIRGKLEKIQVTGGHLKVRIKNGEIELGELAQIKLTSEGELVRVPFDRIDLVSCVLQIDWEGDNIYIPCAGSIINAGSGWVKHDLQLKLQGIPISLHASVFSREGSLTFLVEEEDLDIRALMTIFPGKQLKLPPRLAGRISLGVRGEISRDDERASLTVSATDGWLKTAVAGVPMDTEGMTLELKLGLEDKFQLKELDCRLTAETAKCGEFVANKCAFSLQKAQDNFVFDGESTDDKQRPQKFHGTASVALKQKTESPHADISWELQGHIPEKLTNRLTKGKFDMSQLGPATVTGRIKTMLSKTYSPSFSDFEVLSLQLDLEPGRLVHVPTKTKWEDLSGVLKLEGYIQDDKSQFRMLSGSRLEWNSVNRENLKINKAKILLSEKYEKPALQLTFQENNETQISFKADCVNEITLTAADSLKTTFHEACLSVDTYFSPDLDITKAVIEFEKAESATGSYGFVVDLEKCVLNMELKSADGIKNDFEATLESHSAKLRNNGGEILLDLEQDALMPILCSYDSAKRKGTFSMKCALQEQVDLDVQGQIDLSESKPVGSILVKCNGFILEEKDPIAQIIAKERDILIGGEFSLNGSVQLEQARLIPQFTMDIKDMTLSSEPYNLQIEGINGSVNFIKLTPFCTPGDQRLWIRSLKLGKLDLQNGTIIFRLDDNPDSTFIEHTEWSWLGGRIFCYALRIDPNKPNVDFPLVVDSIELDDLLDLTFKGNAAGEGKIYGMIPVSISLSNLNDIRLGEGNLYATNRKGWWKLGEKTTDSAVWKGLKQQLGQTSQTLKQTSTQENVLNGLLDFEYSKLKIDFVKEEGGLTAQITIRGHSTNEKIPVEFEEIVIKIPNIDETMRKIIAVKSMITESLKSPVER